ncbi:MAG: Methionyl-tRNA synthetase [uncultured Thermomicrobiales bacterium]|uniref:Methionyl-tRNA synthetase n=1 Tax=uncultured Thermomicrobiales bacterium TaxID=1645740 RepID=A0A6J4VNG7_9BACT|nr:MAG: Methionyl-tRNA synthetase [uncultured Thermomicrobiales bacterium]
MAKTNDASQTPAQGQVCRSMAGLGNYNYAADGKSGVAALAGNIRGGVHFRQIGEFRDVGGGRLEGEFEHMFVTEDGSTLRTRDKSWGVPVPGTDYIVGGAAYTVVDGTGEFEGFKGTFRSWGTFAPKEGKAILRYEGQICRPA